MWKKSFCALPREGGRIRHVEFVKAHGTGNDFVLLPDPADELALSAALVRALCDRHHGVGGDGVIRLAPGGEDADVFMDYWNADGSIAEMCGNGVRCVAKYVVDRGGVAGDEVRVGTRAGTKVVVVTDRHADGRVAAVRVDMGTPLETGTVTVRVAGADREATTVSMGNPHIVFVVDDVDVVPLADWAAEVAAGFPEGVNVEAVAVEGPDRVRGRIVERGVGETMSSGTGASAMAVAAALRGVAGRDVTVALPGGNLRVIWSDSRVLVTGPAEEVASGRLDERWMERTRPLVTQEGR